MVNGIKGFFCGISRIRLSTENQKAVTKPKQIQKIKKKFPRAIECLSHERLLFKPTGFVVVYTVNYTGSGLMLHIRLPSVKVLEVFSSGQCRRYQKSWIKIELLKFEHCWFDERSDWWWHFELFDRKLSCMPKGFFQKMVGGKLEFRKRCCWFCGQYLVNRLKTGRQCQLDIIN